MKTSWSTLRSMFISGSSRRPDQSFFFISRASWPWNDSFLSSREFFRGNEQLFAANKRKISRSSIGPEGCPFIEACAIANVMKFQTLLLILSTSLISISHSFVSFYRGCAFLTGVYVRNLLQNRFAFFISLFGLSAILKIRNREHAHYVGLVVTYTWNREKQMFVALGKEFDIFFN